MFTSAYFLSSLIFFSLLRHCAFDGVDHVCVLWESCVLPCGFTPGEDPVIHWTKVPGRIPVHIHYHGQHQHQHQHENYTGRTSLSDQGLPTGDASLQLHKVRVSDEGRYKCYIRTLNSDNIRNTDINLKVYAPVLEVSLQQDEDQFLCRSENIYPKPVVNWTIRQDESVTSVTTLTTLTPSETGQFSVNSSVPLTRHSELEYTCNVSTEHSWRSATYRRNPKITSSDSVTVPCTEPTSPVKRLLWRFNHSQIIVNKTGSDPVYNESWRPFVLEDGLRKSNGLVLKNLTQDQLGLFTCELSTESEDFIINTEVTDEGNLPWEAILGTLGGLAIIALIAAAVVIYVRHKKSPAPVDQNAQILDQDPQILNEVAPILDQDPPILNQVAPILNQDAQILDQDAQILDQDAQILDQDAQILDQDARAVAPNAQMSSTEQALSESMETLPPQMNGDPNLSGAAVIYDAKTEEVNMTGLVST